MALSQEERPGGRKRKPAEFSKDASVSKAFQLAVASALALKHPQLDHLYQEALRRPGINAGQCQLDIVQACLGAGLKRPAKVRLDRMVAELATLHPQQWVDVTTI
ncbi:MAG: hypothetical protein QM749_05135 [Aquabacterium sp.]